MSIVSESPNPTRTSERQSPVSKASAFSLR